MRNATVALVFAAGVFTAASPLAESYPTRPVRVIVPFTAGAGIDVVGRWASQKLSEMWGQPVVVENRTGAGGAVGAGVVARSLPDGYTLLISTTAQATNAALYTKLPYDPMKDFVDISPLVSQPYVLVAGASAGVKSVSGLIATAKARPGQLTFASAGTGSGTHFTAEKFRLAASIDVTHVPYKGGPEANIDTMTGRVTYWFPPIALALPHVREGKLLALGVSSRERTKLLPEVPTIAEAGVGGFEDTIWYGMWAPAATPADVVNKLATDVARALATADVRDRLTNLGTEPMSMTQAEFARFVRSEIESAARVVKAAGIKLQ